MFFPSTAWSEETRTPPPPPLTTLGPAPAQGHDVASPGGDARGRREDRHADLLRRQLRARLLDDAGVDVLLIGDSLGMTLQGGATAPCPSPSTRWPTTCVARGNRFAWIVGDLPFASYHTGTEQALLSAAALMRAGAQWSSSKAAAGRCRWCATSSSVASRCAHLGLTPQSVHALGGYRIQGRDGDGAERLLREARAGRGGAAMLVVELDPERAGERPRKACPSIGDRRRPACWDGQVLVLHDMLGRPTRKAAALRAQLRRTAAASIAPRSRLRRPPSRTAAFPDPAQHGY